MHPSRPPRSLRAQADEAPPPPYSETDIYSNSASSPRIATDDGAASRPSSSPAGDVILTPPETPRTSASNPLSHGASLYFESRPPPPATPLDTLVHTVDVRSTSSPADFPYPSGWAPRDVTPQDWATFINYLLPDHTTRGNEAVFERKLGAQGAPADATVASGRPEAEARLHHTRESSPEAVRRQADADSTIQQWNAAFFGPRGIHVHLFAPLEPGRMPGSWDAILDAHGSDMRPAGPPLPLPFPQQQRRRQQSPRTRNWGGLTISDDGIRYGNRFVADSNGLRIGSLVMDNSGIRIDGHGSEPTSGAHVRPPGLTPWPAPRVPFGASRREPQYQRRRQHDHVGGEEYGDERHSRNSCEGRGRRRESEPRAGLARCDSMSSTSSSSSASSSSTESSIGSLPDYDEIRDQQLPLYVQRLKDWTTQPNHPRSRDDIQKLKADLQRARRAPVDPTHDRKALRAQVKTLSQQWRQLKKQQKSARKAARRERQQKRRADKKKRRRSRREAREARRALRRGRPDSGVAGLPPVPGIIPNAAAAPVESAHHAGRGRCGAGWARGGAFGGFFGPTQQGLFGGGPLGPPFAARESRGCGSPWGRPRGSFLGRGGVAGGPPWDGILDCWPDEAKSRGRGQETGVSVPLPGPESAAKYRAAESLEAAIQLKTKQVAELDGDVGGGLGQTLDKELEALTLSLARVRIEADEALARELSALEERFGHGAR